MSRGLTASNVTAVTADSAGIAILFAELDFSSGFVRCHSSLGTITWGGYDWLGVGTLGQVGTVEESSELQKHTLTYTLTGIPNSMISIVLGESYQGRAAKLYLGFLDQSTGLLSDTPFVIDEGKMDVSDIDEGKELTVTITCESRFSAWDRPLTRRHTDADQQERFTGDVGLQYIDQAATKEINWGRKTT